MEKFVNLEKIVNGEFFFFLKFAKQIWEINWKFGK